MTTKTLTDGLNGVSANDIQHGGTHYKDMTIQPWAVMEAVLTHEEFVGFLERQHHQVQLTPRQEG